MICSLVLLHTKMPSLHTYIIYLIQTPSVYAARHMTSYQWQRLCAITQAASVVCDALSVGAGSIKQEHVAESERSERRLGLRWRSPRCFGHPSLDRFTGGQCVFVTPTDSELQFIWCPAAPPPPLSLYCIASAVQKQPRCCCDATNGRCALTLSN